METTIMRERSKTTRAAEVEAELIQRRQSSAAAMKAARDQEARELPGIILEEEKASKAVQSIRAQLEAAERDLSDVRSRRSALSDRTHRIVAQHEIILRETCSPAIGAFREKMTLLRPRLAGQISHQEAPNGLGKSVIVASTYGSVQAAAERIGEILTRELPAVELQAIGEEEVQQRLEALEQSVPEIVFQKVG